MSNGIQAADMPAAMVAMARRLAEMPLDDALGECAAKLQEGFAANFQRAADSGGGAWPARKDPKPTHPLLQLTGALLASTQSGSPGNITTVDGRTLQTGVDKSVKLGGIPGAAVHQFGYPPRNIAQREYLYATDDVLVACAEVIGDEVVGRVFSQPKE